MGVAATIIIPTFDHGILLKYSLSSAMQQTTKNIEIFVIGDGVPDITRKLVNEFIEKDPRIRFFDNPKGPRHGEIYRHQALQEAKGQIVCYLSDDDLYLPWHVESQLKILKHADFSNTLPTVVMPNHEIICHPVNLEKPEYRQQLLKGKNAIPFTHAAHTLHAYRQLPHGWRTTPLNIPTDLYMYQQFLRKAGFKFSSSTRLSALHFPESLRQQMTPKERENELADWTSRIKKSSFNEWLQEIIIEWLHKKYSDNKLELNHYSTRITYFKNYVSELEKLSRDLKARNKYLSKQLNSVLGSKTWRYKVKLSEISGYSKLAKATKNKKRFL